MINVQNMGFYDTFSNTGLLLLLLLFLLLLYLGFFLILFYFFFLLLLLRLNFMLFFLLLLTTTIIIVFLLTIFLPPFPNFHDFLAAFLDYLIFLSFQNFLIFHCFLTIPNHLSSFWDIKLFYSNAYLSSSILIFGFYLTKSNSLSFKDFLKKAANLAKSGLLVGIKCFPSW